MKTFQTSGRLGDCIYQLYTIKALGGGHILIDLDHHKNPKEKWNAELAMSLAPLLGYQEYIEGVAIKDWGFWPFDVDMVDAEKAPADPLAFPEWHGGNWPGNIHLAKRYAVHFGIEWHRDIPWLTAPKTKDVDVVFHAPKRRTTNAKVLHGALKLLIDAGLEVRVIGGPNDYDEWFQPLWEMVCIQPKDMLDAADYINSAKVMFGAVSSCHAIAEALGKPRLVQQAPDCDNVNSTHVLNGMKADQIVELVKKYL